MSASIRRAWDLRHYAGSINHVHHAHVGRVELVLAVEERAMTELMTPSDVLVPRVGPALAVRRLWAIVEGIEGAVLLALTILGAPVLRHAFNRWRTTKGEGGAPMDGDDVVGAPRLGSTRAITIDAPPEAVWPWLAQIGQGRGGLYSYDALENLIGCDIHSADTILDDCPEPEVGDLVRLGPDGYPTFKVAKAERPRSLVLVGVDPASNEPPSEAAAGTTAPASTWSWRLRPRGARGTRLVTRQRLTFPPAQSVLWHLLEPVTFVMERKMLLGIKTRAERASCSAPCRIPKPAGESALNGRG